MAAVSVIVAVIIAGAAAYYVGQSTATSIGSTVTVTNTITASQTSLISQSATQSQQSQSGGSSVLTDPSGDVGKNATFFDITSGKALLGGGNIAFSVTVAGQIPQSPTGYVAYGWFITSGVTSIDQPIVVLIFDPNVGHWNASILGGRPPTTVAKALSFKLDGNNATVSVSLQSLGNPQRPSGTFSLAWHIVSRSSPFDNASPRIDRAPDSGEVNWSVG
jgi:hypothetical protein